MHPVRWGSIFPGAARGGFSTPHHNRGKQAALDDLFGDLLPGSGVSQNVFGKASPGRRNGNKRFLGEVQFQETRRSRLIGVGGDKIGLVENISESIVIQVQGDINIGLLFSWFLPPGATFPARRGFVDIMAESAFNASNFKGFDVF